MTNFNSEGTFENEWDEPGELAWREIDWELYLQEQDGAVREYLSHYDALATHAERLDEAARRMGWEQMAKEAEAAAENTPADEGREDAPEPEADWEPYTLHKNPVYIATKALHLSLTQNWAQLAAGSGQVPPPLGIALLTTLNRGYEQSLLATQAVDLGDYGLAVCLFKRALRELNSSLAHLDAGAGGQSHGLADYRRYALPRLFDLREIWLRVLNECREELGPGADEENGE